MGAIESQITSPTIVYSTVYLGADQSKHQSSASLAFVWGIHRGPVNSPHKWPVTRKMFPFDDVIMEWTCWNRVTYMRQCSRPPLVTWWRHQMEIFSALLAICVGNSPVPGELPTQRPVTWSFDVYFDLRPNKRLSKQSLGWGFETLSPPLWGHRNENSDMLPVRRQAYIRTNIG